MNIEERLRQLKKISPKTDYSERSRSFILSSSQEIVRPRLTLWSFVLQNVQLGSAMALTGLLLLLGFGGFSAWKFLSPFGLSSLDPANLRAEAEAVNDIGVALNSIQYVPTRDTSPTAMSLSQNNGGAQEARQQKIAATPAPAGQSALLANETSTPSAADTEASDMNMPSSTPDDFSTTTVDEALDLLLQ